MNITLLIISILVLIIILLIVLFYIYLNYSLNYKKKKINKNAFQNVWNKKDKNLALDMLEFILKLKGITFVAAYGTLLGIMRHKGFIPWDDDIDIITDIKNYYKLLELKPFFRKYGLDIVVHTKYKLLKIFPLLKPKIKNYTWSWPFIDIFFYKIDNNIVRIITHNKKDDIGKITDFFPLKYKKFEKIIIPIPNKPEKWLNLRYKNWKTICIDSGYRHKKEKKILPKVFRKKCNETK